MFNVLSGTPTILIGDRTYLLKPGDFVGLQPGSTELHMIENRSTEDAHVLGIKSKPQSDKTLPDERTFCAPGVSS